MKNSNEIKYKVHFSKASDSSISANIRNAECTILDFYRTKPEQYKEFNWELSTGKEIGDLSDSIMGNAAYRTHRFGYFNVRIDFVDMKVVKMNIWSKSIAEFDKEELKLFDTLGFELSTFAKQTGQSIEDWFE